MKLRHTPPLLAALLGVVFTLELGAQVPETITYQGRVRVEDTPFTGTGRFKFALVDQGMNTNQTATATATVLAGRIQNITVTDGGTGYVDPPRVFFVGTGGRGASAEAVISDGQVVAIKILNGGTGYLFISVRIESPPPGLANTTYWSNDGTSTNGSEPNFAIGLPVENGLFTAVLGEEQFITFGQQQIPIMVPIPPSVFSDPAVRLRVWFDDGVNGFEQLQPDTPIGSVGYAMVAARVPDASITTSQLVANTVTGTILADDAVTGVKVEDGSLSVSDVDLGTFETTFWKLDGNAGAEAGTHFLGTTDGTPLELRVGDEPVLRLEAGSSFGSGNIIGGAEFNVVTNLSQSRSVQGGFIGAGGSRVGPNSLEDDYSVIAGGFGNTNRGGQAFLGGGFRNLADRDYVVLVGGILNRAIGARSFLGGGEFNELSSGFIPSVLCGGSTNKVASDGTFLGGGALNEIFFGCDFATIGGGVGNFIDFNSACSTIPGGANNTVRGRYSFAAGRRAQAMHPGTFVWADSTDANFTSTDTNQFLVRAEGGVGINTANPGATLDVAGTVKGEFVDIRKSSGSADVRFKVGNSWSAVISQSPSSLFSIENGGSPRVFLTSNGRVGIGTDTPSERLHVAGDILATGTITPNSDRAAKTDIAPVDPQRVLESVSALPIHQWRFKEENAGVQHLGPMAQDFHAAFGLGESETAIATVDADGVALAAIQGLNKKLQTELELRDAEIENLKAELAELKAVLDGLKPAP